MERGELRLGEALTEERCWEAEGVTVLRAAAALPQLEGGSRRARRFNGYYRRFCRAYFAYCEELLYPEAADSCRAAVAVSAPWSAARAELSWRVSHRAGPLLSIVCDAAESVSGLPGFRVRRSEIWDLDAGLPVPAGELFPPHSRWKRELLRFLRGEAQRRVEAGAPYRPDWRAALRRYLNPRSVYLTPEGLCLHYPLCALAPAGAGIVTFTMPYDGEKGPLPPGGGEK